MRYFVTGHDGFIGRALCRELELHEHLACGYDIRSGGELVGADDILDSDRLLNAMLAAAPDVVVHLAAEVGKLNCEQHPARAAQVNVTGTLNVAKACASLGVPLVYASTSEVYGDRGSAWVDELDDINADGLSGAYAITKLAGEYVAQTYAPEGLKIIRPTMPYGPGVPPGPGRRALDNLIWQALTGQPMIVHREAARSWCWIGDLARGFRYVIERGEPGAYNVGRDDDEVEMVDLAHLIFDAVRRDGRAAEVRSEIHVITPPARQTAVKRLSCDRLRALGWAPQTALDAGLPVMVAWIRRWLGADEQATPTAARR